MKRLANFAFRILNSRYLLVLVLAGAWVIFFDRYNVISQRSMQVQIEELETDKAFYKKALTTELRTSQVFDHPDDLERFARERYFMKKSDEDVFLAE
ncbi:MAG: septum formation initiator family protein [Bacteroidia bacterium]